MLKLCSHKVHIKIVFEWIRGGVHIPILKCISNTGIDRYVLVINPSSTESKMGLGIDGSDQSLMS